MPTPIAPASFYRKRSYRFANVARAHSTPRSLALRAHIVLRAAGPERPTNLQIGHALGCSNLTVGKWRRRYLALGLPGLQFVMRQGVRDDCLPHAFQVISVASAFLKTRIAPSPGGPQMNSSPPCSTPYTPSDEPLKYLASPARRRSQAPQECVWLNSHDADFDTRAHAICQLYAKALDYYAQGRLVLCGMKNGHASAGAQSPHQTCAARATRTA